MLDPQNLGAFIVTVVTTPFILILFVVIVVFARAARKATASQRWPATTGRILSSSVGSHRSLDSDGTHTTIYEPDITYEYTADGRTFQSQLISFGAISGTSGSGWAESFVEKYPAGSPVQVYYNPQKPAEAVLEHAGAGGNTCFMLIFILVELILVGILVLGLTGRMG